MIWVLVLLSFVLFAIGTPIFVAFGLTSSIICIMVLGLPPAIVAQKLWAFLNSFTMLAAPLFIWSGALMLSGGTSARLIGAFNSFTKHLPGGLAIGVVMATAFFSAMCGSTIATACAIGTFMGPEMVKQGYDRSFANGLIASAAPLGPIIPPSIWMVLYAGITESNVAKLFLSGVVPGLLIAAGFIPYVIWIAKRRKYARAAAASWRERGTAVWKALPALLGPVLVLGGIYGGIVTPTEAACVAVVYAIAVGTLAYRDLTLKEVWTSLLESARTTSTLFVLIVGALLLGFVLYQSRVQDYLTQFFIARQFGPTVFLVAYMLLNLVLGCFVDGNVILFLTVPLLFPIALALHIDPVFLGLIIVISLSIGQISPPFGIAVFTVSAFSKEPAGPIFRQSLPFILIYVVVLFVIVFVPQLAMWLPNLYD